MTRRIEGPAWLEVMRRAREYLEAVEAHEDASMVSCAMGEGDAWQRRHETTYAAMRDARRALMDALDAWGAS